MIPKQVFLSLTKDILAPSTVEQGFQKSISPEFHDSSTFCSHIMDNDVNTLIDPISVDSIFLGSWKASEHDGFRVFTEKIPRGVDHDLSMIDHHPFTNNHKEYQLDDINSIMSYWDEFENPRKTTSIESSKIDSSEESKSLEADHSTNEGQPGTPGTLKKHQTRKGNDHVGKHLQFQPTSSRKKFRKSKTMKDLLQSTKAASSSNHGISKETTGENRLENETEEIPAWEEVSQSRSIVDQSDKDIRSIYDPLKGEILLYVRSQKSRVRAKSLSPSNPSDQGAHLIQKHGKHTEKASKPDEIFKNQLEDIMQPVAINIENLANRQIPEMNKVFKDSVAYKNTARISQQSPGSSLGHSIQESTPLNESNGYKSISDSESIQHNQYFTFQNQHKQLRSKLAVSKGPAAIGIKRKYFNSDNKRKVRNKDGTGSDQVEKMTSTPAKLLKTKNVEDKPGNKKNQPENGSQSQPELTNLENIQPSGSSTVNENEEFQWYERRTRSNNIKDRGSRSKRRVKNQFPQDDHTDRHKISSDFLSATAVLNPERITAELPSQEIAAPSTREPKRVLLPVKTSILITKIKEFLKEEGEAHVSFMRSREAAWRKTRDLVFTSAHQGKQIIHTNKEIFKDISHTFNSVEKLMTKTLRRHGFELKMENFNTIVPFKAEHVFFPIFIRQVSWICHLTKDLSISTKDHSISERFTDTSLVYTSASEFFCKWLQSNAHAYLDYVEENIKTPIWKKMKDFRESPQIDSPIQLIHHLEFATLTPRWTIISWYIFWEWLKDFDLNLFDLIHFVRPNESNILLDFKIHYSRDVMHQMYEQDGHVQEDVFCHLYNLPRYKLKRLKSDIQD
ncbi:hypothetical protein DFH28DRAFT_1168966 [Melampsora americana]|nr:hypothetical protein DFH28DRAFT_1168966 [Melampsora americana]